MQDCQKQYESSKPVLAERTGHFLQPRLELKRIEQTTLRNQE